MARIRVETEGAEEMKQISVMLRGILGLKQHELAQLLSTTKTTVSTWETRGIVSLSRKATPFANLVQVIALVRQCKTHPDFLSFEKLKAYIKITVKGDLHTYYSHFVGRAIDEHFFNALKMTNLFSLLFALQLDRYLESIGLESPERQIVAGGSDRREEELLSVSSIVNIMNEISSDEGFSGVASEPRPVVKGRPRRSAREEQGLFSIVDKLPDSEPELEAEAETETVAESVSSGEGQEESAPDEVGNISELLGSVGFAKPVSKPGKPSATAAKKTKRVS